MVTVGAIYRFITELQLCGAEAIKATSGAMYSIGIVHFLVCGAIKEHIAVLISAGAIRILTIFVTQIVVKKSGSRHLTAKLVKLIKKRPSRVVGPAVHLSVKCIAMPVGLGVYLHRALRREITNNTLSSGVAGALKEMDLIHLGDSMLLPTVNT